MNSVPARPTTSQPIIRCVFPALAIALLVCLSAHAAPIWYVAADAESGGDGNSWAAAYQELQPAIDAAYTAGGGVVWVKAGIYTAGGDPETGALVVHSGVTVRGGFAGTEDNASARPAELETIISGSEALMGGVAEYGVVLESGTALDRCTVTGGTKTAVLVSDAVDVLLDRCTIRNQSLQQQPGSEFASGLTIKDSAQVEIRSCTLEGNKPSMGFFLVRSSNISFFNCLIADNEAAGGAGGIVHICDDVVFDQCRFTGNSATVAAGALSIGGDRFPRDFSNRCIITRCVFEQNSADSYGAVVLGAVNSARIDRTIFRNNTSVHTAGALRIGEYDYSLGGNCYEYAAHVTNSLFIDNEVTGGNGGAIWMIGGSFFEKSGGAGEKLTLARPCSYIDDNFPGSSYTFTPALISNCTFARNTASNLGGAIYMQTQFGEPPATNCIFWENSSPAVYSTASYDAGWTTILFSLMQEEHPADGNFVGDPGFMDPDDGDFRLRADSVCIDAGIQTTGSSFGNVTTDIDGRARGFDGDGQGAVTADGSDYDIGAYEYMPPVFHTADPDQSWSISLTELLRVIQHFNSAGYRCAATPEATEDGYLPGDKGATTCAPHASDYNPQDWHIELGELLRLIQFYNTGGYAECEGSEDGFCVGE